MTSNRFASSPQDKEEHHVNRDTLKNNSSRFTFKKSSSLKFRNEFFITTDFVERFSNTYFKELDSDKPIKFESIYEVVFKSKRTSLYTNRHNLKIKLGDFVVVETDNGLDVASVSSCGKDAEAKLYTRYNNEKPKLSILRFVTNEDYDRFEKNQIEEELAIARTRELIIEHNLEMKITDAEWQFDRQRLTVSFISPHRVDFRNLVRDLAREFKTRIELRQISTREEAKRLGGMGTCGKSLCCVKFGCDNCHITLDHARIQQLSTNVSKLSGYCGRLKCCLIYEFDTYAEAMRELPEVGSRIMFDIDYGRVVKTDIFKSNSLIQLEKAGTYRLLDKDEISLLYKSNKVLPPERRFENDEELEELKRMAD